MKINEVDGEEDNWKHVGKEKEQKVGTWYNITGSTSNHSLLLGYWKWVQMNEVDGEEDNWKYVGKKKEQVG